jgi:hypothetical protein
MIGAPNDLMRCGSGLLARCKSDGKLRRCKTSKPSCDNVLNQYLVTGSAMDFGWYEDIFMGIPGDCYPTYDISASPWDGVVTAYNVCKWRATYTGIVSWNNRGFRSCYIELQTPPFPSEYGTAWYLGVTFALIINGVKGYQTSGHYWKTTGKTPVGVYSTSGDPLNHNCTSPSTLTVS